MKKLTRFLAMLLICLTVFSTVAMAAEGTLPQQETTVGTEIVLPGIPEKISVDSKYQDCLDISWDAVEGADGYDIYLKEYKGEWTYKTSVTNPEATIGNLMYNRTYVIGVKSYIIVDGVKYESEKMRERETGKFGGLPPVEGLKAAATSEGIKLSWDRCYGTSFYRVYIRENNKWKKITDIKDNSVCNYLYKNVKAGEKYYFAVKAFVKSYYTSGGGIDTYRITYPKDLTKTEITYKQSLTERTVDLEWSEIANADGYRIYIFKDNKWSALKTVKGLTYKAEGLEPSTKYKFKVKAYFKVDGETKWGAYSDVVSVTTCQAFVDSYRLEELKKYFTDGDWCVKLGSQKDEKGNIYDFTLAVKGNSIFARYDYKNNKTLRDTEYLADFDNEKVYMIFDDNKTYVLLPDDKAAQVADSLLNAVLVMDMSDVNDVTGKTTIYKDKTAVAEFYRNPEIGIKKKTYYYINEKLSGLKINYTDGTAESFSPIEISDTPSSSVFKVPSGYKKAAY